MSNDFDWERLQSIYTKKYIEIMQGKELSRNLTEVNEAISELDEIILRERQKGIQTPRLDSIKNDFFYLIYLIKEQQ